MAQQQSLFSNGLAAPEGLRYQPELICRDEEAVLAAWIATLSLQPFEFHGYLGNRRVLSFGFRYDYSRQKVEQAPDIPAPLLELRGKAARFAGVKPFEFVQALVTEYAPGAGIGWHRDKPQFGQVVGISLLSEARLRLRRKEGARWQRRSKIIAPRSAYLLSGPVRLEWEHSIPVQEKLRYSITFRGLAR